MRAFLRHWARGFLAHWLEPHADDKFDQEVKSWVEEAKLASLMT
jgi:hypothetical protein